MRRQEFRAVRQFAPFGSLRRWAVCAVRKSAQFVGWRRYCRRTLSLAPFCDWLLIHQGTPEFRRTNLALFSAGFATFALLYCVQPLMPVFAREFHVKAAQSSLTLSLTTGLLAPAMMVAGSWSCL